MYPCSPGRTNGTTGAFARGAGGGGDDDGRPVVAVELLRRGPARPDGFGALEPVDARRPGERLPDGRDHQERRDRARCRLHDAVLPVARPDQGGGHLRMTQVRAVPKLNPGATAAGTL